MWIVRLIVAPVLIAALTLVAVLMVIYCGLGWIFTGNASVSIAWPTWN
jgi:hypothetical protein